jgi:hypothetical protein
MIAVLLYWLCKYNTIAVPLLLKPVIAGPGFPAPGAD